MPKKLFLSFAIFTLIGAGCAKGGTQSAPSASSAGSAKAESLEACLNSCSGLAAKACKANCYTKKAIETGEVSYCGPLLAIGPQAVNVAGSGIDVAGYSYCVTKFAQERRQPVACDKLTESGKYNATDRYVCISNVARRYRDPSMCNLVSDAILKRACTSGAGQR